MGRQEDQSKFVYSELRRRIFFALFVQNVAELILQKTELSQKHFANCKLSNNFSTIIQHQTTKTARGLEFCQNFEQDES